MKVWKPNGLIKRVFAVALIVSMLTDLVFAVQKNRYRGSYRETYSELDDLPIEEKLYSYIFRKYNQEIRPVIHPKESVNVNITFSLMQINSLDEKTQVFRTYGWLVVEWRDPRLSWFAEDYGNMTEFIVDSSKLWTPELALINAVEYQFPDFSKYRAILSFDGKVRWEPAGVFETFCKIDISFYPYDEQKCELVFGTWTYTSFQVNLSHSSPKVITDDYNTSGEWDISTTEMNTFIFKYNCCPDLRFSKVSATIHLKRKHRFYTMHLVLPCAMLSSLTLVTFLSPPDQGEKISLGISILLSFSVFMLALSENMPKTSDGIPLFGIFTTYVMLMNTTSVMLTVFVLNLHHRHDNKPVPRWIRAFAFKGLARILCMSKKEPRTNLRLIRRKRGRDSREAYSLTFAAEQFSDQINYRKHLASLNSNNSFNSSNNKSHYFRKNNHSSNGDSVMYRHDNMPAVTCGNTDSASTGLDDKARECHEALLRDNSMIEQNSLDDWRELARVMDRLFFWFTLLAMVVFCASISIAALHNATSEPPQAS